MNLTSKNDKNLDLMIKNSNLYELEKLHTMSHVLIFFFFNLHPLTHCGIIEKKNYFYGFIYIERVCGKRALYLH